jgi:NADPH:quinone reductase-like Zn-dependent oxidoreductase
MAAVANQVHSTAQQIGAVGWNPIDAATQPPTGWAEYVVGRYNSLLPVPDKISNEIAAQMVINSITTSVLIKAGHNSLQARISLAVYILQNAAASGVGRLLTHVALDRGVFEEVDRIVTVKPHSWSDLPSLTQC